MQGLLSIFEDLTTDHQILRDFEFSFETDIEYIFKKVSEISQLYDLRVADITEFNNGLSKTLLFVLDQHGVGKISIRIATTSLGYYLLGSEIRGLEQVRGQIAPSFGRNEVSGAEMEAVCKKLDCFTVNRSQEGVLEILLGKFVVREKDENTFEVQVAVKDHVRSPREALKIESNQPAEQAVTDQMYLKIQNQILTNEILRQKKVAQELNKTIDELGDLTYVVSHDLKAPLRGIQSLFNYLVQDMSTQLAPENQNMIDLIRDRICKMETMISGILEFTKITQNAEQPEVLFNSGESALEVMEYLYVEDEFRMEVQDELPDIYFPKLAFQHILINLIGNAMKYNDSPNGVIGFKCEELEDEYVFCLWDNGPGIPKEFHKDVFKFGKTLVNKFSYKSSGLGLSIVKKLIERWKGRTWVESEPGRGAHFYFSIKNGMGITP